MELGKVNRPNCGNLLFGFLLLTVGLWNEISFQMKTVLTSDLGLCNPNGKNKPMPLKRTVYIYQDTNICLPAGVSDVREVNVHDEAEGLLAHCLVHVFLKTKYAMTSFGQMLS